MKLMNDLTWERLNSILSYDGDTGLFKWLISRGVARAGDIAGSIDSYGYIEIQVDGRSRRAHRLAWFYFNKDIPDLDIDHINGVRTDNRINNLRCVTRRVNIQNQRAPGSRNTTGYLGVTRNKRGKYQATIVINGQSTYIGTYLLAADASAAYIRAKRRHHAGCTI